ncbi:MAG TPA: hypothetical protein VK365_08590, partial [Nocardioidaceae bacterium]|nr:hypothetical protein [Nocardioidaceae bacterium]
MSMLHERGGATGSTATAEPPEHREPRTDDRPTERADAAPSNGASRAPEAGFAVHRRRGALALVGTGALVVAVAYLWRAVSGGSPLGYLLAAAMLPICVVHLAAWWDARVPVLVADPTGLRLREGRSWTGLRWEDAPMLRLTSRRLPHRDGRLVVEHGDGGTRTLPLALVDPADLQALPDELRQLAGSRVEVLVDSRDGGSLTEPAEPLAQPPARTPPATPATTPPASSPATPAAEPAATP